MSEWIEITREKRPTTWETVLLLDREQEVYVGYYTAGGSYRYRNDKRLNLNGATHYMHLPALPTQPMEISND